MDVAIVTGVWAQAVRNTINKPKMALVFMAIPFLGLN